MSKQLSQINAQTGKLQAEMWSAVQVAAAASANSPSRPDGYGHERCFELAGPYAGSMVKPDSDCGLGLMAAIAICANVIIGFGARKPRSEFWLLLILPLVVSVAFFLIADIDSPRGGLIRVNPQNLLSLSQSLRAH